MKHLVLLTAAVLAVSVLLCSCGGSGGSAPNDTMLAAGNWYLRSTSSVLLNPNIIELRGFLSQSGTTISGVVSAAYPINCRNYSWQMPVSGTVSGGSVTFTVTNSFGETITITSNAEYTSSAAIEGSYRVTGGCADGWHGNMSGVFVPPLSGNWSGTLSSGSAGIEASALITQEVSANGFFPLTGTVSFAGSPCFTSGSLAAGSWVLGNLVTLKVATNDGGVIEYQGELNEPSTATKISSGLDYSGDYRIVGGNCSGESGSGTLIKS